MKAVALAASAALSASPAPVQDSETSIRRNGSQPAVEGSADWFTGQVRIENAFRTELPDVDLIDLDYPSWHKASDDLQHVSAQSLQAVGDVLIAALPLIEARLR